MKLLTRTLAKQLLVVALLLLGAAEAVPRLLGLTDFPIYRFDSDLGYIPAPNQSGRFLNRNAWSFNDYSMATDVRWDHSVASNVLLIGNSIVQGGGPLDQKDRLGTVLQNSLGSRFRVWPIAVGGWSNVNETSYLERFADVAKASDFFVWEYMAGGLSELSHPRSEYLTPSAQPWFASWYVTRRYLLPRYFDFGESELPPTGIPKSENLARFEAMITQLSGSADGGPRGIIFLYPEKDKFSLARDGQEWLPERAQIEALARRHKVLIIDIARQSEWKESLYRDPAHLTAEGNRVLGQILLRGMQSVMVSKTSDRSIN